MMAGILRAAALITVIGFCFAQSAEGADKTTTPSPLAVPDAIGYLASPTEHGAQAFETTFPAPGFIVGRTVSIGDAANKEDRIITSINNVTFQLNLPMNFPHNSTDTVIKMYPQDTIAPEEDCRIRNIDGTCKDCTIVVPPECTIPFAYKGITYRTCTGTDATKVLWCSEKSQFDGNWKECTDPCKNDWSTKKIVGAAVAGGIALAGVGIGAALIANGEGTHTHTIDYGSSGLSGNLKTPGVPARLLEEPFYDSVATESIGMDLDAAHAYDYIGFFVVGLILGVVLLAAIRRVGKKSHRHGAVAPDTQVASA